MNLGNRNLVLNTRNTPATDRTFILGTSAAPDILVVNSTGTVLVTSANNAGNSMTINGNIYVDSNTSLTINEGTSGTTIINGLLFGTNTVSVLGGAFLNGAVVSNNTTISQESTVSYNLTGESAINNTISGYCGGAYAVVAGSWRDF
jgi:hypothetical protein